MTLEFKICFERRLWAPGYPQKQTGWSYDTWIDFYGDRRTEVASSQMDILKQKLKTSKIFEDHILQRMVKIIGSTHGIPMK